MRKCSARKAAHLFVLLYKRSGHVNKNVEQISLQELAVRATKVYPRDIVTVIGAGACGRDETAETVSATASAQTMPSFIRAVR